MWSQFALAVPCCLLFLYVPGFLLGRSFNFSRVVSLATAPAISMLLYVALGIVYQKLGIFSSWASVFAPIALVSVCAFAWTAHLRKRAGCISEPLSYGIPKRIGKLKAWQVLAAFYLSATIIASYVFLGTLDAPGLFADAFDNTMHQSLVRHMLDSGNWSCLYTPLYDDLHAGANAGSGFYPAMWHLMGAMVASAVGATGSLGANAFVFVVLATMFPGGMFLYLSLILKDRPHALLWSIPLPLCFCIFPWTALLWGIIYPNFLGFSLLPIAVFAFMAVLEHGINRKQRVPASLLFLVATVSVALGHPNSVFTAVVLLLPYCVHLLATRPLPEFLKRFNPHLVRGGVIALFLLFVLAIWIGLYHLPTFKDIIATEWTSSYEVPETIFYILSLGFDAAPPQLAFTPFLLAGLIFAFRRSDYRWVAVSFVLFCTLFSAGVIVGGKVASYLIGFWYNDAHRLSCSAVFAFIPIVALGLDIGADAITRWYDSKHEYRMQDLEDARQRLCTLHHEPRPHGELHLIYNWLQDKKEFHIQRKAAHEKLYGKNQTSHFAQMAKHIHTKSAVCVLLVLALGVLNFAPIYLGNWPGYDICTPFMSIRSQLHNISRTDSSSYDTAERNFVKRAKKITGDDLVINNPFDGSVYAYANDDMNIYYRDRMPGSTSDSTIIRTRLDQIAINKAVQNAVKSTGAKYVLVLDRPYSYHRSTSTAAYDFMAWRGITGVFDDTPGFTVELAEIGTGNRLYRIDPL